MTSNNIVNLKEFEELSDDMEELMEETFQVFNEQYKVSFENLNSAIQKEDLKEIQFHSHKIKGMLSAFFCEQSRNTAQEIETSAQSDASFAFLESANKLNQEVDSFKEFFNDYYKKKAS